MLYIRLLLLLVSVALIAGGLLYINTTKGAMVSFLVAYFSSATVLMASFKNYQDMVAANLKNGAFNSDDRDIVEKIDDPYDLYSKEEETDSKDINIKEIIKEEKRALKAQRGSLKSLLKNSIYAFRFSRLLAYGVVVLGFFYLLKSKMMVLGYYLAALALPIIVVVFYLMVINRKNISEAEH